MTRGHEEAIPHEENRSVYPICKAQERLLTVCLQNRRTIKTAYNNILLIDFIGKMDLERLKKAINQIFSRHRILKAQFSMEGNGIVQSIQDEWKIEPEIKEIDERDKESRIFEFSVPFKMLGGQLVRCEILLYGMEKGTIVFDFHHTVFDGMCINLFSRELLQAYGDEELPTLGFDYLDYCLHENRQSSEISKECLKFWEGKKQTYLNWDAILYGQSFRQPHHFEGTRKKYKLFEDAEAVKAYSRQWNVTIYQMLMANYILTMAHETENDNVILGTVASGRDWPGTEKVIGVFVETIPIIVCVNRRMMFAEFLTEIREEVMEAFAHKTSLDQLHEIFGRQGIVYNLFEYQNLGVQNIKKNDIVLIPSRYSLNKGIKFPLLFETFEEVGDLYLNVEYATNLYNEGNIDRFVKCYSKMLQESIQNPNKKIDELFDIID